MTAEEKTTRPFADLVNETTRNYEHVVRNAFKVQQESLRWWGAMLGATTPNGQSQSKTFIDELLPHTQRSMNEWLKVWEENSRASVELFKKSVAMAQADSLQDAQNKATSLWEAAARAAADTTQAITHATTKSFGVSLEMMRKAATAAEAGTRS